MLSSDDIKRIALKAGADVVGIAPIERFAGFPADNDPHYVMPEARSMIVMGHRIMRGSLRGTEEGTFLSHYPAMGEGYLNMDIIPLTARQVSRAIEDEGYEAMPIGNSCRWAATSTKGLTLAEKAVWRANDSVPARPGQPAPDVYIDTVLAAYLAGLGDIGYSGTLLNPIYGPRLRFGCVLTEMALAADPVMVPGTLCNRCMACVRECPGKAMSATKTVKLNLGGYEVEWAERDEDACSLASVGAEKTRDGEAGCYLDSIPAYKGQYKPSAISPFRRKLGPIFTDGESICAGKGCIRACMISLEERGVLANKFDAPFRRREQWSVDWDGYYSGRLANGELPPNAVKPREKDRTTIDINE